LGSGGKRFVSDPLRFTGVDLSSKPQRRGYAFEDSEPDTEESYSDSSDGNQSAKQIELREKEEALVQSALARIRRAQEKGKSEVKLEPDELAALERRRKRMQSAATASKPRKSSASNGSGSDRKRRKDRAMVTVPIMQPEARRHSGVRRGHSPTRPPSGGPGIVVEGPGGVLSYAPIGHNPPTSSKRSSPTRPRSSTSLSQGRRQTPPLQASDYSQGNRYFSEEYRRPTSSGSPRRPLPDEEDWVPGGSRRSSVSSQVYDSIDPFDYQTSSGHPPPIPQQYMQPQDPRRRNVSGPAQVSYSSVRRSPPISASSSSTRMRHSMTADDPYLRRSRAEEEVQDSQGSLSNSEDEYDPNDELGHGVSVAERPPERSTAVVSRKPVGGGGNGGKKKGRR
jgi:hypothetical protein